jgi:hypothetical protein
LCCFRQSSNPSFQGAAFFVAKNAEEIMRTQKTVCQELTGFSSFSRPFLGRVAGRRKEERTSLRDSSDFFEKVQKKFS